MTTWSAARRVMADALTSYGASAAARYARAWSSFCHAVDRTSGRNWALSVSPAAESPARLVNAEMRPEPTAMTASREPVSYTHLRAHETVLDLVCRLLLDKKKKK